MRPALAVAVAALAALSGCLSVGDGGLAGDGGCGPAPEPTVREVEVRNHAGGGRLAGGASQEVPFPLGRNEWSCVRAVEVTVAWTNTPESGADLYVGYRVASAGLDVVGNDRQQTIADGRHEERVLGPPPQPASALASDLEVVLYTDWASLSASGLPATVTVRLHHAD